MPAIAVAGVARHLLTVERMTRRKLLAIAPGLLVLHCASRTPEKAAAKTADPVTGLHALYQMYTFARTWAQDLKVIRLSSINIPEVKAVPGKAGAWQVLFSSEALGKARIYTFSVYDESVTLRQGIFADAVGSLSSDMHSFAIGEAAADSDKAWEISLGHSQKYTQEHSDIPVSFILEYDPERKVPVWRVIWGLSAAKSPFSVLVDARAGAFLRTLS